MEDHSLAILVSKQTTQQTHQWQEYELLTRTCARVQCKMDAAGLPTMSVPTDQTTQHHIQEDSNFRNALRGNYVD